MGAPTCPPAGVCRQKYLHTWGFYSSTVFIPLIIFLYTKKEKTPEGFVSVQHAASRAVTFIKPRSVQHYVPCLRVFLSHSQQPCPGLALPPAVHALAARGMACPKTTAHL